MKEDRIYNFNAGPAALPLEVLEEIKESFFGSVHRFRVQRSGLKTKKGLKIRSPRKKCSFSQVIANLASNFGLGLTKLMLFS